MLLRLFPLLLFSYFQTAFADPLEVDLPTFSCTGMKESIRLPPKLPQLRQMAKLNEEKTIQIHEWDGYKTLEKLYSFKGLYLHIITFTNDPDRYMLGAAFIESSEWSVSPIRVGSPVAVLNRLGLAQPSDNGTWRFNGEADSLYVEVRAGRVSRVVYECYTG
jgi:hypothetical protein